MDYIDLFQRVKVNTGMYLQEGSYNEAIAFIVGCDAGNDWCLLIGFREWLIVRIDGYNNLSWPGLVKKIIFIEKSNLNIDIEIGQENRIEVNMLFDVVIEFLYKRNEPDGMRNIFRSYTDWLDKQ